MFSKRAAAIDTVLEAGDEAVLTKAERMRARDWASLATRTKKDRTLTPERLRDRWAHEAAQAGIPRPGRVERMVCHLATPADTFTREGLFAKLVDPDIGLCACEARFGEAHVVERIAALSAGRLTVPEIETLAAEFLVSDLVVRLAPTDQPPRRRPAEWSTVEHRTVEDAVLRDVEALRARTDAGIDGPTVFDAIDTAPIGLGEDQEDAVAALCEAGPALRVVLAPAGHGKTALTAVATKAAVAADRRVVALATTNKAVAELRAAGVGAQTIARFRLDGAQLPPDTVLILDEVSQVSTRDAQVVLRAVAETPGAMLWCLGDDDQGRPVRPGGLARELRRLAERGDVAAGELTVNRRQRHPVEREALAAYRDGRIEQSQSLRRGQGWEHDHATPAATRDALAAAAVADADQLGVANVAVLAVSHADCEDLADRIRALRRSRGELSGRELHGPGWGPDPRDYAAGDRVLLHANLAVGRAWLTNGTTGTVLTVRPTGLVTRFENGGQVTLPLEFVAGIRPDGTPNLSHAWARTVDGAQGGTWDQAHLLATPNLDRLTAYVGQSRSRRPTHTWNTVPTPDYEHPNVVADPRTPAERILAAETRLPDRRFAAHDDPNVLDRRLHAELAGHHRALAQGPPDVTARLAVAVRSQERLARLGRAAWDEINRCERRVAETAGLRQLRPTNRRAHHGASDARDAAAGAMARLQEQQRVERAVMHGPVDS